MPDNGSGTYTLPRSMSADDEAGVKIVSTNFDEQHDDIASALNARLTKNGENSPSANLPMATFKHTNVGNASARNQYLTMGQALDGKAIYCSASASANEIKLTAEVTCSALVTGQTFAFVATSTVTGSTTLSLDGLTAVAVQKHGRALVSGEVVSGAAYIVTHDGTQFQLHGEVSASEDRAGIIEIATTAEVTAGTDTSRAVTPAGLKAALAAGGDGTFAEVSASSVTVTESVTVGADVSASADIYAGGNYYGDGSKLTMGIQFYATDKEFATADQGNLLIFSSTGSTMLSLPTSASAAIPIGAGCIFTQDSTGEVRVSANAGVTLVTEVGKITNAQYAVAGVIKTSADKWRAFGSLKA